MHFAEKILTLRKHAGLSQEALAEKLDVSRQAVSRWEKGTALPDAENLLRLSKLFGVTVDELIKASTAVPHAKAAAEKPKLTLPAILKTELICLAAVVLGATILFTFTAEIPVFLLPIFAFPLPILILSVRQKTPISLRNVLAAALPFFLAVNLVTLIGCRLSYELRFGENYLAFILWENIFCYSNTAGLLSFGILLPFLTSAKKPPLSILAYLLVVGSVSVLACALYSIISDCSPSLLLTWLTGILVFLGGCLLYDFLQRRGRDGASEKM